MKKKMPQSRHISPTDINIVQNTWHVICNILHCHLQLLDNLELLLDYFDCAQCIWIYRMKFEWLVRVNFIHLKIHICKIPTLTISVIILSWKDLKNIAV